ncbi:MAG: DUF3341 domain-containing protein [Bacteroidetes bacterium]|nr:MAG: DUF3341 domain-containing protein [Bacteroidota bacterium]
MNNRYLLCAFEREADILSATRLAREQGYKIADVYTPYAVHGLDEAQGVKPSKLPWITFALGVSGAIAKLWYQLWTSATSWPVNVGGKPLKSVPAFVPVTFEIMVLFAGIGTVLAFFVVSKLFPGKKKFVKFERATDNRFYLALEETDAAFDVAKIERMFLPYHCVLTSENVELGYAGDRGARENRR